MDYEICDPSIRCGADKIGASIFVIEQSKGRTCRVLAFSWSDAERLAREYSENEKPQEDVPSLFDEF